MKNKIAAIILVIIMLIPAVIAIANYSAQQSGEADSHNTVSVTVTDPAGTEYVFERADKEDKVVIDYFLSAIEASDSVGALPTTIQIGDFYQCTLKTAVKEFGYKFYFTGTAADCYFVDGDGNAFKMGEADAEYFLTSPYAGALYENGTMPVMSVSGNAASPASAEWYFTDCNGKTVKADATPFISDKAGDIKVEGGLAMSFPIQPDSFTVIVTDLASGNVLFNDAYENLGTMELGETEKVGVEANAKWYEDAERTYFGEQTYKFNASVSAPAQFYAGATEIEIGEFICVTGVNVANKDEVSFSSSPSISYSPVFFEDGDYIRALIPFNWDLAAGSYALTFDYGGTSQIINVTLSERTNPFRDSTTNIPEGVVAANGSEEALTKCKTEMLTVAKSAEQAGTRYFDGEFIEGVGDATITGGFGHTYSVNGTDIKYRHTGVDYSTGASVDVKAVNAGVVIYAGYMDYSGYTVVVEHGYGLKSWYCHMAKTSVNVGDKLNRGDAVGVTGSSGFISGAGAHVGLTIFDTPVCQYALWSDGVRRGIPMYGTDK